MSPYEGLPFYLSSHEGFHKTCGSRGYVTYIRVLIFALYKRYVVVAVVLNISAHSICFIQKVSGSRGYITHIRVSTLLYTPARTYVQRRLGPVTDSSESWVSHAGEVS